MRLINSSVFDEAYWFEVAADGPFTTARVCRQARPNRRGGGRCGVLRRICAFVFLEDLLACWFASRGRRVGAKTRLRAGQLCPCAQRVLCVRVPNVAPRGACVPRGLPQVFPKSSKMFYDRTPLGSYPLACCSHATPASMLLGPW